MNDREERAIWKLTQGDYRVTKRDGRYLLTTTESITELDTLTDLVAFAEAVYERVWTGRRITPSA
jgi:hypothetical protein